MSIEAMKLALFALDIVKIHYTQNRHINEAIAALKERLAQPEQEPVAWAMDYDIESVLSGFSTSLMGTAMRIESAFPKHRVKLLYTTPPQRTWVGLTDEEIKEFDTWHDNREEEVGWCNPSEIVAYIEAKLKEKNTQQRTEQNFCPRCGKRTPDLITIHTCTPPKD